MCASVMTAALSRWKLGSGRHFVNMSVIILVVDTYVLVVSYLYRCGIVSRGGAVAQVNVFVSVRDHFILTEFDRGLVVFTKVYRGFHFDS